MLLEIKSVSVLKQATGNKSKPLMLMKENHGGLKGVVEEGWFALGVSGLRRSAFGGQLVMRGVSRSFIGLGLALGLALVPRRLRQTAATRRTATSHYSVTFALKLRIRIKQFRISVLTAALYFEVFYFPLYSFVRPQAQRSEAQGNLT